MTQSSCPLTTVTDIEHHNITSRCLGLYMGDSLLHLRGETIRPARRPVKEVLLLLQTRPSTAALPHHLPSVPSRVPFFPYPPCSEDAPCRPWCRHQGITRGDRSRPTPAPHHESVHPSSPPPWNLPRLRVAAMGNVALLHSTLPLPRSNLVPLCAGPFNFAAAPIQPRAT
jgi:hypothetical protein